MRWILPVGRAMALQNGQLGAMNQRTTLPRRSWSVSGSELNQCSSFQPGAGWPMRPLTPEPFQREYRGRGLVVIGVYLTLEDDDDLLSASATKTIELSDSATRCRNSLSPYIQMPSPR
jgi:hypothetical protein